MDWQVRKCPVGMRPRVEDLPSVAEKPNEHWATNMCRIWSGCDGLGDVGVGIDCYGRELLDWHLSRSGRSKTAESALEQALIERFGTLGRVPAPFLLRSDNGLVFTGRAFPVQMKGYGLRQEFLTQHSPQETGWSNV